jgi:branched-chain amino acid transport system substrate-binding protein
MSMHRRALFGLGLAAGLTIPQLAMAEDTIKIGVLATFEGAFAILGDDSMRGALMAFDDFGGKVGGKKIEVVKGSSDGSPDSAVRAIRKLVEQDGVKVIVGPLSGDEGLAVKDYAKTKPDVTIVNGTSAAQDTTLRDPAPNFASRRMARSGWRASAITLTTPSTTTPSRRWRKTIPSRIHRCSASWRRSARPAAMW